MVLMIKVLIIMDFAKVFDKVPQNRYTKLSERFRAVNTSNSSYSSNKSNSKSCLSTHAQTLGSTRLQ